MANIDIDRIINDYCFGILDSKDAVLKSLYANKSFINSFDLSIGEIKYHEGFYSEYCFSADCLHDFYREDNRVLENAFYNHKYKESNSMLYKKKLFKNQIKNISKLLEIFKEIGFKQEESYINRLIDELKKSYIGLENSLDELSRLEFKQWLDMREDQLKQEWSLRKQIVLKEIYSVFQESKDLSFLLKNIDLKKNKVTVSKFLNKDFEPNIDKVTRVITKSDYSTLSGFEADFMEKR